MVLRSILSCLLASTLLACGQVAPGPAVGVRATAGEALAVTSEGVPHDFKLVGRVDATGYHGAWIPTMNVLGVPGADWINPFAQHDAQNYVDDHQAAWHKAIRALDATTQKRSAAIMRLVADQPMGAAGLIELALSGKLTASASRPGQPTILDSLAAMAEQPIAPRMDRAALLGETLAELDVPGRIIQGIKLTCEATSVQIMLDQRDPAEYARLVAGLASAGGKVALADGSTISRVPDWTAGNDGWRSIPGRLIQPAFAVFANGPLGYNNTKDRNSLGQSGLTDPQVVVLCTAVFATPFSYLAPDNSDNARRYKVYQAALAAGWQVPSWLDWFGGHVVLGEPMKQERVVIDNPLGAIHSIAPGAFTKVLHSVYVPTAFLGS